MNDRAVSSTLGYVLALGIMFLLTTGLFVTGGDFIDDQRNQAVRSEMQVIGQQVSNDLSRIDRSVEDSNPTSGDTVRFDEQIPERVAGSNYYIELVTSTPKPHLLLTTQDPEVTVRVNVTATTDLRSSRIDGGQYSIEYDDSTGEIAINDE